MNKYILISLITILIVSCKSAKYQYKSASVKYLPVVTTTNPDSSLVSMVQKYKTQLDSVMDQEIGCSETYMEIGRPESLLTNFTSDAILHFDEICHSDYKPDLAMMNIHSHRASIPKGKITLNAVFRTYSFDNTLVFVKIKGSILKELFRAYAKMGGAGISANVKLEIRNKDISKALINGMPIDENKVYTIVTLDYLAEGNDGMDDMISAESIVGTGIILRDYMLNYIKTLTNNGRKLNSVLDGRIIIKDEL